MTGSRLVNEAGQTALGGCSEKVRKPEQRLLMFYPSTQTRLYRGWCGRMEVEEAWLAHARRMRLHIDVKLHLSCPEEEVERSVWMGAVGRQ